jgi:hypothetical protein
MDGWMETPVTVGLLQHLRPLDYPEPAQQLSFLKLPLIEALSLCLLLFQGVFFSLLESLLSSTSSCL